MLGVKPRRVSILVSTLVVCEHVHFDPAAKAASWGCVRLLPTEKGVHRIQPDPMFLNACNEADDLSLGATMSSHCVRTVSSTRESVPTPKE